MQVENILERIKECRKKKGLSQKQLGEKIGLTQQAVALLEQGRRRLDLETLNNIATVLETNTSYLINEFPNDDIIPYQNEDGNLRFTRIPAPDDQISKDNAIYEFCMADMMEAFNKLNDTGKNVAVSRVQELTEIERYTRNED